MRAIRVVAALVFVLSGAQIRAQEGRQGGPGPIVPAAAGPPARGVQVGAPMPTSSEFTVGTLNTERNVGASYPRVIQLMPTSSAA